MCGQQSTNVAIDAFTKSANNLMMESVNKFAATSSTNINQEANIGAINLSGIAGIFSASPLAMVIVLIIICVGGYFGYKKYVSGNNSGDDIFTSFGSLFVDGGNVSGGSCGCNGGADLLSNNEFLL